MCIRDSNLSLRHVSLSTCGLVDGIYRLMEKKLQLTLSISLHAPNDEIRSQTMPVNHKYPMDELLRACREYFKPVSYTHLDVYKRQSLQKAQKNSKIIKYWVCRSFFNEAKQTGTDY